MNHILVYMFVINQIPYDEVTKELETLVKYPSLTENWL